MVNATLRLLCAAALLAPLVRAEAQEKAPAKGKEDVYTLGEITVNEAAEPRAIATESTVTSEQMQQFDRNTLAESANLMAGVTFATVGPRNEQWLYVRGLDQKHAPIFLDGIPVYVPYDGYPDLGRFFTYGLSEIVVSKGFTSVLYGPNTMGGAINMVTRRPSTALDGSMGVRAETGREPGKANTYDLWANLGSKLNSNFYVQGSGSIEYSDAFELSSHFNPALDAASAAAGQGVGVRVNSYQRDWSVSAKVGWTPRASDEYVLSYSYEHGVKGVPPYIGQDTTNNSVRYWRWPYWDWQNFAFTSKTEIAEKSYLKTRVYFDLFPNSIYAYDNDTYTTITKKFAFQSAYNDYTYGASAELGTLAVPYNDLKAAFFFKDDIHIQNETLPVQPNQRFEDRIYSVGVEDTVKVGPQFSAIGGVSLDQMQMVTANYLESNNQQESFQAAGFGPLASASAWNPQLGIFWSDPGNLGTFHAAFARKSRLPSIKDIYSFKLGTGFPNTALEAERANNWEIGYQNMWNATRISATGFYHDIHDFIQANPTNCDQLGAGACSLVTQAVVNVDENIGNVHQYGAELELTLPMSQYAELGGNYTLVHSQVVSSAPSGAGLASPKVITGVPQDKVFAYLRLKPVAWFYLQGSTEYDSLIYSTTSSTTGAGIDTCGNFVIFAAKVGWTPVPGADIQVGVNNIGDRYYAYSEGFPMPGRTYFAQASYKF